MGSFLSNNQSTFGMFDLKSKQIAWNQEYPVQLFNDVVFESSTYSVYISGFDSNQRMMVLKMNLHDYSIKGYDYVLPGKSFASVYSSVITGQSMSGVMVLGQDIPGNTANVILVTNTSAVLISASVVVTGGYTIQAAAVTALQIYQYY